MKRVEIIKLTDTDPTKILLRRYKTYALNHKTLRAGDIVTMVGMPSDEFPLLR